MAVKPVLFLTGFYKATVQDLEPQMRKFNRPMGTGVLNDGREFRIISATHPSDQEKLLGLEFSALIPSHNPDHRCMEIAAIRVR